MTHASAAALASGYERSRSGKATLTMERSRAAMNAPRAVRPKTAAAGAGSVRSLMERTVVWYVPSCNPLVARGGTRAPDQPPGPQLLHRPVPRGHRRLVDAAD